MPVESYIGGANGGVPQKIFNSDKESSFIKGRSGNPLFIEMSRSSVRIWDMVWNCHFIASVDNGVLSVDAWTKGFKGANQKHPDLFFGDLLVRTMERFKEQGIEVRSALCDWEDDWDANRTSDLYWEFMSGLGDEPTQQDMVEAAKNTSAGKILGKFGLKHVDNVEIRKFNGKEKVVAVFSMEPQSEPVAV